MPAIRLLILVLGLSAATFPAVIVTPIDRAKIYASWAAKLSRAKWANEKGFNQGDTESAWLSTFASGLVQHPEGRIRFNWVAKLKNTPSFQNQIDSIFSQSKRDSIAAYKAFENNDKTSVSAAIEYATMINELDTLLASNLPLTPSHQDQSSWIAWMAWNAVYLSNLAKDAWHVRTVKNANDTRKNARNNWESAFAAIIASDAWRVRSSIDSIELAKIISDTKKFGARPPFPQWPPRNYTID